MGRDSDGDREIPGSLLSAFSADDCGSGGEHPALQTLHLCLLANVGHSLQAPLNKTFVLRGSNYSTYYNTLRSGNAEFTFTNAYMAAARYCG